MKNLLKYKSGFTLIELMVVVGIIAILSGFSLFALNKARESGRDAKRRGDLAQIAQGIEIFKADCNFYPNGPLPGPGNPLTGSQAPCALANTYVESMPEDPDSLRSYGYSPQPAGCEGTDNCTGFELWAALENPPAVPPTYCNDDPGTCGETCNFCIINP